MNSAVPRLRMFAGPNGSGKSTLKSYLSPSLLGVYLNPDEMEQTIRLKRFLDFSDFQITPTADRTQKFFASSTLLRAAGIADQVAKLVFSHACVDFNAVPVNSYLAAVAVELIRHELLEQKTSFTFETVMSHSSKVAFLADAQSVRLNGHSVPKDKIVERYHRSLDLLLDAIRHTNRAYIFDNSSDSAAGKQIWLAEITEGKKLELKTDTIPAWFKRAVLDKIK